MASITLMILGDSLDPRNVTRALRMRPTQQWRRGERDRVVPTHIYEWGGWKKWSTDKESKKELIEALEHWCLKLTPRKAELARLSRSGNQIFLDFCLVGETSELCLPPQLLRRIA